jgi:hypothetical protein
VMIPNQLLHDPVVAELRRSGVKVNGQ